MCWTASYFCLSPPAPHSPIVNLQDYLFKKLYRFYQGLMGKGVTFDFTKNFLVRLLRFLFFFEPSIPIVISKLVLCNRLLRPLSFMMISALIRVPSETDPKGCIGIYKRRFVMGITSCTHRGQEVSQCHLQAEELRKLVV